MTARVGDPARFVTWSVVAFTAVAAGVSVLGLWTGRKRPGWCAAGVLPALVVSYLLPAAPFVVVFVVLVGFAVAAVRVGGVASGMAAVVGALMVVAVVLQGPAVECGQSSVSSGSGPWWIAQASNSSSSGSMSAAGDATGTTQVGHDRYSYRCQGGRLVDFTRVAGP
jgi:hypothetical protein